MFLGRKKKRTQDELAALRAAVQLCDQTHEPFRELAEEISSRIAEAASKLSLDDAIEQVVSDLTGEEVAELLREKFEELPPNQQLALLLKHLPGAQKLGWLRAQSKRLERLANPQTVTKQLIADARRTRFLEVGKLPEGTRLEVTMLCYQCIDTPESAVTTVMDRAIVVVRRKGGFYLLSDLYDGKAYGGVSEVVPHSTVFTLGIMEMTSRTNGRLEQKLIFGGQAHFAHGGHFYPFDLYQLGTTRTMLVARCIVDGVDAFVGPD